MHRKFFILFLFITIIFSFFCNKNENINKSNTKNVLLITIDTLRFDRLSVYTDKYLRTKNIEEFSRSSLVFTRAFSHNPVTLPAHTNILTGVTPLYHGISDNTGFRLGDKFLTIAEYLKSKGYDTGAFVGAFPLDSRFGLSQGFNLYDDNYGAHNEMKIFFVERKAEKVITPALNWLKNRKNKWFMWVHLFDPHQPYFPPEEFQSKFKNDLYSGEVAYVDSQLKRLFDYLREKGLLNNTMVILTADHGEALGEKGEQTHSYFAYNNTIHIPLIIHVPNQEHKIINQNVCHIDIFPTICDYVGLKIPPHIQGKSIFKIIGNKDKQGLIYFESLSAYLNRGWAPLRGFIDKNIKFIDQPIAEVYDIEKDINEENNLAKEYDLKVLRAKLFGLMKRYENKNRTKRGKISAEMRKRMQSLGYFAGETKEKKRVFTEKDDLKTMLSVHNKMLDAIALYQSGEIEKSINIMKVILTESPNYIMAYKRLAEIYEGMNKIEDSLKILNLGLKNNPDNVSLMASLGITLIKSKSIDKGIEILNKCLKVKDYDPDIYNYLGMGYVELKEYDKALEYFNKALKFDVNSPVILNNIGALYLRQYLLTKSNTYHQLAMEYFNKALKFDERNYNALNGRASAYKFVKNYINAINDWIRVIEIKPDFIDAYFNLGITYIEIGEKMNARRFLLVLKEKFFENLSDSDKQRLIRLINETF